MKKIILCIAAFSTLVLWGCADTNIDVKKEVFPYTKVAGEYLADFNLTGAAEGTDRQHVLIYNTASAKDSLWIEDRQFYVSKVKVHWDGQYSFSITNGDDLRFGEIVNITGQVYPEKDSLHVEWRYLQGGDPADDYVVTADGALYTGLKN